MSRWINFFFNVCLFKAAPQDAPASKTVEYSALLGYWAAGVALTMFGQPFIQAVIVATIQTLISVFFLHLVLWIRGNPERIVQTITAFAGSGIIIVIAAFPLIAWYQPEMEAGTVLQFLGLLLIIWQTVVVGHILRHALDVPVFAGIGIALVYMYLSFAITLRFIKLLSVSLT